MKYWLILLFILTLPVAYGATVYGTVYSLDLTVVDNVIVELNSTPTQRDITEQGQYSFEIAPGTYTLTAKEIIDGDIIAKVEENITIKEEGIFLYDLILFPAFEELEPEQLEDLPEVDILVDDRNWFDFILIMIFLAFLFFIVYHFKVKPEEEKTEKVTREIIKKEAEESDLDKIVNFIKQEGGRITQKDLRRKFPYSEGKMSLMIAELEERGNLKKIKRGRGNILILQ